MVMSSPAWDVGCGPITSIIPSTVLGMMVVIGIIPSVDIIWPSLGTKLSDATEEKAWRRLLHRAWDAKNRHPREPDHSCRLGCGCTDESMLHMIKCVKARPLWAACLRFARIVLGAPDSPNYIMAVIFGTCGPHQLLPESTRAFLRHAVGLYYRDATRIHRNGSRTCWEYTFRDAIANFQKALMRYAYSMRRLYANRKHTNLTAVVPETDRDRFAEVLKIRTDGTFVISSALKGALHAAEQRAATANARLGYS